MPSSITSSSSSTNNNSDLEYGHVTPYRLNEVEPKEDEDRENNDQSSIVSSDTAQGYEGDSNLKLHKTETEKSLRELGIRKDVPQQDLNQAPVSDPIFPEEYVLETETGLVKAKTLESLGREPTRGTRTHSINDKTEFVTFKIDDPENPLNWPMWIKWVYTVLFSFSVISAAYGSSCLSGGLFTINDKYGVSTEVSTLTVSLMVLGFCVGPLLWAPLSEQIGRRPVYIISFGLYTIFNIPCALSPNIGGLLVCRFLCGVFAASALTNAGASLVDIHSDTRGLAIAFFSFCPYSGPVLGGVVNGFISVGTNRFDLMVWVNMAFAGVMWIILALIPETYAPVILKKRAKKLRKETGNPHIMTEQEASPLSFKEMVKLNLLLPLKFVVTEPVLDLVCGYVALIYALLYAFFFAYPYIFNQLYGYKDNKIGLMLIPILIGAGLAVTTTPFLEKHYIKVTTKLYSEGKPVPPELRLWGAMIGAPFPAIALFILGATSYKHIIWVGPASSGIAFGYGMVLIYYSLNNYIIDTYAKYAASALATKVFLRSTAGAAFPLFVTYMYEGLGLQWASWLLAFVSLANVLIPFAFYKYGKVLRAKWCKEDYTVHKDNF
ncbi:spermine transporter [Lodderomyces elongisporus]|uniref:spermine transporter n=1 Tax=Lodderomyces elongisporus TaxID=36914 RepID=UPI002920F65B|nr:spermine transporter [Lodderomyces elongisporus]WLF76621.1 spermine transporter [Lodderomyces elongisporus]